LLTLVLNQGLLVGSNIAIQTKVKLAGPHTISLQPTANEIKLPENGGLFIVEGSGHDISWVARDSMVEGRQITLRFKENMTLKSQSGNSNPDGTLYLKADHNTNPGTVISLAVLLGGWQELFRNGL